MVFFPDQALRLPDPEGGSRSAARGFAAGNAFRRSRLAEFQAAAEGERAAAESARADAALDIRRDELGLMRDRFGLAEDRFRSEQETSEQARVLQGAQTLGRILNGIVKAPADIFPQVFRSGLETAKSLGVDVSKYDGLTADQVKQQAAIDLHTLGQLNESDAFTLSAGQTRFGPDGKPLASVDQSDDTFTLSPGQTRFGPDGKPLATAERPGVKLLTAAEKEAAGIPSSAVVQRLADGKLQVVTGTGTATNPVNVKFPDGRIQGFDPRSQELRDALKVPGAVEVGLNVQAGSVADLPGKNRQDEIRSTIGAINRARNKIGQIRASIRQNRSRAGLVGTATRLGQRAAGIALDFADIGVDVPGVVSDISTDLVDDIESGRAEESIASFFDAKLPQNQVFENSLAYALARARKGTGRLNLQDVENARTDVSVTGLSSVDEVLARLEAVDSEFGEAQIDLRSRLKGETRGGDGAFRVEGGRLVPDD